jgi:hypothetical protein
VRERFAQIDRRGRCRANRLNGRAAASHNRLNLLESQPERAPFNGSSYTAVDSSRENEPEVEFINHPRAVSGSANSGWAFRAVGDGGWGAPDRRGIIRAARLCARHGSFGAGTQ